MQFICSPGLQHGLKRFLSKSDVHNYLRDNDLKVLGWEVFHFNSHQIQEQMTEYCLPTVVKKINALGGVEEGKPVPRKDRSEFSSRVIPAIVV